jgi:hypothetical protein
MIDPRQPKSIASNRRVHLTATDVQVLRVLVREFAGVCQSGDLRLELAQIDERLSQTAAVRPRQAGRHS